MILMWLGSLVLVLWGLRESRRHATATLAGVQKRLYIQGFEGKFSAILKRIVALTLIEASPQRSLYTGLAFYNMRILAQRPAVLMMCFSSLGAWWVLLLALLYLNFSGLIFLSGGAFLFVGALQGKKILTPFLKWSLMTGVFLLGGELMLRQSSVVSTLLGTSSLAFFLSDGRFGAVLGLMAASYILSLIIEEEFWVLPLILSLVVASTISLNGVLGVFAGERLARVTLFWWRSRGLNQECRRVGWQFAASSAVGVLMGLLIAGEARAQLIGNFYGSEGMQDKLLVMTLLCGVILLFQFALQMLWGHFGCRVNVTEVQEAKYFSPAWGARNLLSENGSMWAKVKVHQRLSEIRYHLQGLDTVKAGQIPEVLQARLKTEEQQLSQLENEVLKALG